MNKYITVPKDREAMIALDYNTASSEQLYELLLTEETFQSLWNIGLFQEINEIASTNIDFAEDESITEVNTIIKLIESVTFNRVYLNKEINTIISQIKELLLKAIDCKTGIFFYF